LYWADLNGWIAGVEQAFDFSSVPRAARFAFDEKVPDAEIVVRCDLLEQEVAVPLLPQWCDAHEPRSTAN
jgi:hypothetical protein